MKNHEIYNKKINIWYLTKRDHNNLKSIENIIIYTVDEIIWNNKNNII